MCHRRAIQNREAEAGSPSAPLPAPRQRQRGFALLLVFAMAAVVAVVLYMQLPRVAFEAQRDRESMLIQRGKQYRRAIELYVRKNNRYPQRLEDLERDQEVRFLRRRYKDPLTGKDEWRLIHVNAAGQLTDSLVEKPKNAGNPETASTTAEEQKEDENVAENIALARQRPGDQNAANAAFPGSETAGARPPAGGDVQGNPALDEALVPLLDASGNVVQQTRTEAESQALQQGIAPGQSGASPGSDVASRQASTGGPGATATTPELGPGGIPILSSGSSGPASPANPGQAGAGGAGSVPLGNNTTGTGAAGQQNAQQVLNNLLTRDVPNGLAGLQQRRGVQTASSAGGGLGAGIAGVASRREMKGILVYNEQESIHKWEFVYSTQQTTQNANSRSGNSGTSGARPGSGQSGTGTSGFGGSGFGGSGFGGSEGGSRPAGQPRGGFSPGGQMPGGYGQGPRSPGGAQPAPTPRR